MSVMILDAGNSIIKAKIAQGELGEIAYPHALQPITESEYLTILSRAGKNTPSSGLRSGQRAAVRYW